MNKERKKQIQKIIIQLNCCSGNLEDINFDESFARDNIPENLQEGESYRKSADCSDIIEDAISDIRSAVSSLEEI